MRITTIIFDLWNTLGVKNASFSTALKEHFSLEAEHNFYKRFEQSMQLQVWKTKEEMAVSFLQEFGLESSRRNTSFVVLAQETVLAQATPFENMNRLLSHLKEQYSLAILSNTTFFEAKVIEDWGFVRYFDTHLFSWESKKLKPDHDVYRMFCEKMRVAPNECLFVDDNKKNCEAARAIGMHAYQFTTVAEFVLFLRKDGLWPREDIR